MRPMAGEPNKTQRRIITVGNGSIYALEVLGLLLITIATVIAGAREVAKMVQVREVTLADLLLLFI